MNNLKKQKIADKKRTKGSDRLVFATWMDEIRSCTMGPTKRLFNQFKGNGLLRGKKSQKD